MLDRLCICCLQPRVAQSVRGRICHERLTELCSGHRTLFVKLTQLQGSWILITVIPLEAPQRVLFAPAGSQLPLHAWLNMGCPDVLVVLPGQMVQIKLQHQTSIKRQQALH